jgi:uncharacterized protein (DUF1800 family)
VHAGIAARRGLLHASAGPAARRTPWSGARMRVVGAAIAAAALWSALSAPAPALDAGEARHLLQRTGFGASVAEIDALAPLTREQAVDRILASAGRPVVVPPPAWLSDPRPDWDAHHRSADEEEKRLFNRRRDAEAAELKAWWFAEMIATPSPFGERMTLFWHGHFTSAFDKVRHPDLMLVQNELFRAEAVGNFRRLVHAVARDPAMMRYLDTTAGGRARPNENFSRELMELYLLGEGSGYGEADVKEAARVFAGWRVDNRTGRFAVDARQTDDGVKRVLGAEVRTADELIDHLLSRPEPSRLVAAKLWREFVSPDPPQAAVEEVAAVLREGGWELAPAVRRILLHPDFWDPRTRGALVKSPADLLVGTIRTFGLQVGDTAQLVEPARRLGQDLFNPPNVKGWPGHTAWITTNTMLVRRDVLQRLLRGAEVGAPPAVLAEMGMGGMGGTGGPGGTAGGAASPAARAGAPRAAGAAGWAMAHPDIAGDGPALVRFVLPVPPAEPLDGEPSATARIERLVLDPAFQVK